MDEDQRRAVSKLTAAARRLSGAADALLDACQELREAELSEWADGLIDDWIRVSTAAEKAAKAATLARRFGSWEAYEAAEDEHQRALRELEHARNYALERLDAAERRYEKAARRLRT